MYVPKFNKKKLQCGSVNAIAFVSHRFQNNDEMEPRRYFKSCRFNKSQFRENESNVPTIIGFIFFRQPIESGREEEAALTNFAAKIRI